MNADAGPIDAPVVNADILAIPIDACSGCADRVAPEVNVHVTGADVEALKFTQVLRGYKASEVDWVLDRLGQELDSLRGELAVLRASAPRHEYTADHRGAHEAPDPS